MSISISLISEKSIDVEHFINRYVKTSGYYNKQSIERAQTQIKSIQQSDDIQLIDFKKDENKIIGEMNLFSKSSLQKKIIEPLTEINKQDISDSLFVQTIYQLHASIRKYSGLIFIGYLILILSFLSREYIFWMPFWKGNVYWGTCTTYTAIRSGFCLMSFVIFISGLFWNRLNTKCFDVMQWFMGLFLLFSVIFSLYDPSPLEYIPSLTFLGFNFLIFCVMMFYYLKLQYQSAKLLVLLDCQDINVLLKTTQIQNL